MLHRQPASTGGVPLLEPIGRWISVMVFVTGKERCGDILRHPDRVRSPTGSRLDTPLPSSSRAAIFQGWAKVMLRRGCGC